MAKNAKTGENVYAGQNGENVGTGRDTVKTPARTRENWQNQENVEPVEKISAGAENWPFSLP